MIYMYFFAFVFSVFLFMLISQETKRYNNTLSILTAITIVIVNFGYWQLAKSTDIKEALLANRISYLDGTFLTLFMLMSLAKFCDIKLPKWILGTLFTLSTVVLGLVFTGGYSGLYYKEVSLAHKHGIAIIEKTYGPAHNVYYILLAFYILSMIAILIYAFNHKERYSYINTFFYFCIVLCCIMVYVVEIVFSLDITLLPFAYVLMETLLYFLFRRTNVYDISANATNVRNETGIYGYISFNTVKHYIGCNDKAKEFFKELENQKIDYAFPKSETFLYNEFYKWIDEFEDGAIASKHIERDGKILYCTLNIFKQATLGNKHGYLIEIYDDTKRQLSIKKMHEMNENLANLVDEAEKANRAKSEFLALMSHEIRTPINAVLGLDEIILRETEESEIRKYAENIRTAGDALLFTVNDLLDFSKIEQGKMEISHSLYSLTDCVSDVIQIISLNLKKKGLSLILDIDKNIPVHYYGDAMRLKQILINLLTNSTKYTDEGSISLSIKQKQRSGNYLNLVFSVKDTGRGIKKEDQEVLFDSFTRFDINKNNDIEGSGLGLNITSNILRLMGSTLQVESTYGIGSNFYFELRQEFFGKEVVGDYFRNNKFNSIEKSSGQGVVVNKHKVSFTAPEATLLLVDDNTMNLYVFQKILKTLDISADTATSGNDAIKMVQEKKYDIIFMDHLMPELDGIETLKIMRNDSLNLSKDAIVIMFTANAISGHENVYKNSGFNDVIVKPVKPDKLENMLLKYLPKEKKIYTKGNSKPGQFSGSKANGQQGQFSSTKANAPQGQFSSDNAQSEKSSNTRPKPQSAPVSNEIDTATGLKFANQDKEFYLELLEIYIEEHEEKRPMLISELEEVKNNNSFKEFIRLVHDLKGESRGIGATALGDMFFNLEQAGKDEDKELIINNFNSTIERYDKVVNYIKTSLLK